MYFASRLKIPFEEGKLVVKHTKANTFILYETGRKYIKKTGHTEPIRVTIGRQCKDDPAMMNPNEKFLTYFPGKLITLRTIEGRGADEARHVYQHSGAYIAVASVILEYGLRDILDGIFGNHDAGLLLDLASYAIIWQSNKNAFFTSYSTCHPLFTPGMKIVSDSYLSDFMQRIDRDHIVRFLEAWNAKQDHRQRVYVSYDSTNKNYQAGDIEIVEFGKAKDKPDKPIFNFSIVYDKDNEKPLFYELYAGGIPDVAELQYMVSKVYEYRYRGIGFILDRGYFSRDNLKYIDDHGYAFIIMCKGCKSLVSEIIEASQGTFEHRIECAVPGHLVYGTTVKRKMYEDDQKERCFHLFFDAGKMAAEEKDLRGKIEAIKLALDARIGYKFEMPKEFLKYFTPYYDGENKLQFCKRNNDAIDRELKLCGYFCIISSEEMSAQDAYELYKSRDISEKIFSDDKAFIGGGSERAHSVESMETKIFIEFIALIIRNRMYTLIRNEKERTRCKKNYMEVDNAIRILDEVNLLRETQNSGYILENSLGPAQKAILRAFGMAPEDAENRLAEVGAELLRAVPASRSELEAGLGAENAA